MATTPNTSGTQHRAEQAGANVGRKAGETLDKAREAASFAAGRVQDRPEGAARTAQDMASNVGQTMKDAASTVANRVEDAYEATTETINEFNEDFMKLVSRHPNQAVLIAFGVGCMVGALMLGGIFATGQRG